MATNGFQEHRGRETRLLVLVVVVSIGVLLLLARFRFPAADAATAPSAPSPLAGLAGRAAFDDLGQTMVALMGKVSPRLVVIRMEPVSGAAPSPQGAASHFAVALRVRQDLALVHTPPGLRPVSTLGSAQVPEVVAADVTRQLALVRVDTAADGRLEPVSDAFAGFTYVAAVDATSAGLTIQPVFVGRATTRADDRWPDGLTAIGDVPLAPTGSFVFSIDAHLIGLVVRDGQGALVVPGSVLDTVVTALAPQGAVAP